MHIVGMVVAVLLNLYVLTLPVRQETPRPRHHINEFSSVDRFDLRCEENARSNALKICESAVKTLPKYVPTEPDSRPLDRIGTIVLRSSVIPMNEETSLATVDFMVYVLMFDPWTKTAYNVIVMKGTYYTVQPTLQAGAEARQTIEKLFHLLALKFNAGREQMRA